MITYPIAPSEINPTGVTSSQIANYNANPALSEYALKYGYDVAVHLMPQIQKDIYAAIPAQFNIFRLLFNLDVEYVPGDETKWSERGVPRVPVTVLSETSNSSGTQVIVLTAGGGQHVARNLVLQYPDDLSTGIIDSVSTDTITIKAPQGVSSLPTLSAGDILVPQVPLITDGMNYFEQYDKLVTQEHTNYIGLFQRNKRWTRLMKVKYNQGGLTNYYETDIKEQAELAYTDAFGALWNGKKASYNIYNGTNYQPAKMPNGIFPMLRDNGGIHATASPATLVSTFERCADLTNYKNPDEPRFLFGTNKALYNLSKAYKNPIRYSPNDSIANLNLKEYEIGNMKFVPMTTELFKAQSGIFPATWENRIFCLDLNALKTTCIASYQPIEQGSNSSLQKGNGGREDYTDFYIQVCIGTKIHNVNSHFWIDVNGI